MVGASRERVNKAIASFVRLGWIEQQRPPLPHHQPRGAEPPGPLTARNPFLRRKWLPWRPISTQNPWGYGCGQTARKSTTRRQASAASSGRWAGRAASCTKPWSAPW